MDMHLLAGTPWPPHNTCLLPSQNICFIILSDSREGLGMEDREELVCLTESPTTTILIVGVTLGSLSGELGKTNRWRLTSVR